jgi:hypothetical protein
MAGDNDDMVRSGRKPNRSPKGNNNLEEPFKGRLILLKKFLKQNFYTPL